MFNQALDWGNFTPCVGSPKLNCQVYRCFMSISMNWKTKLRLSFYLTYWFPVNSDWIHLEVFFGLSYIGVVSTSYQLHWYDRICFKRQSVQCSSESFTILSSRLSVFVGNCDIINKVRRGKVSVQLSLPWLGWCLQFGRPLSLAVKAGSGPCSLQRTDGIGISFVFQVFVRNVLQHTINVGVPMDN